MKIDTQDVIDEAVEKGWPVANEETVREIVFALKEAYERVINDPKRKAPVSFVDGFMAVANFSRLVIEDLEERTGIKSLEYKAEFRRTWLNTVARGLMQRLLS
jgi:hypothetical protein